MEERWIQPIEAVHEYLASIGSADVSTIEALYGIVKGDRSLQIAQWHEEDGSPRWFVFGLRKDGSGSWAIVGGGGGGGDDQPRGHAWVNLAGVWGARDCYLGGRVSGPGSDTVTMIRLRSGTQTIASSAVENRSVGFLLEGAPNAAVDPDVVVELLDASGKVVSAHRASDARLRL